MGAHLRPGQKLPGYRPLPGFRLFLAARSPSHERFIPHAHRRQRLYKDMGRAALHRGDRARSARSHRRRIRGGHCRRSYSRAAQKRCRGTTIPSGSPFGTLTTDAGTSTCAASGNDDGASPLSAHRGICSPTAGLWCSPVSGGPLRAIRHGRSSLRRGRRGRSLRASRGRTALPGAGRRAVFESLVFPHVRELRYRGIEPHGLFHGRRSCRVPRSASP